MINIEKIIDIINRLPNSSGEVIHEKSNLLSLLKACKKRGEYDDFCNETYQKALDFLNNYFLTELR